MSRKKAKEDVPVSFRLPVGMQELLIKKARSEDLNISQYVRRALRRDLSERGMLVGKGESRAA